MSDIFTADNAKAVECDDCSDTTPGPPLAAAWPAGWLRIHRPSERGPLDFCPDCAALLARRAQMLQTQGKKNEDAQT